MGLRRMSLGSVRVRQPVRRLWRLWHLVTPLLLCLFVALPAASQPVPWRRGNIDLQAANEPLNVFLARILTWQGISASISATVATGRVNGRFRGPAQTIFQDLSETYGLTSYFDGSRLHIYSLAENESKLLQVLPADVPRVERILREMRLEDRNFPLRIDRTEGTVYVGGPPKYVEVVADVVAAVAQAPSRQALRQEVRIFPLRHARATDSVVVIGGVETTVPGVARILAEAVRDALPPAPEARLMPRTVQGLQGKGLISIGRAPRAGDAPGSALGSGNASAGATGAPSAMSPMPPSGNAAASPDGGERTPGRLFTRAADDAQPAQPENRPAAVTADARTNAVIVRDIAERMPMYAELVRQLDTELPLVDIEATVIDISSGKSEQLGVDWRLKSRRLDISSSPNGLAGTGETPRNEANDLLFGSALLSAGRGVVGTLVLGNELNYFLSRVNALAEAGDAKVAANPRIVTINNHEAVLQSTRDFYVRVAGRDQVDLFPVSTGLTLRVTPTLVSDAKGQRFKLVVRIEDGNANAGGQVDQIPVVSRQAISTQAVVGDGESLLIGGYVVEERREGKTGVPVLSSLPIVGALFRQNSNEYKRIERMFLITPRLARPTQSQGEEPKP